MWIAALAVAACGDADSDPGKHPTTDAGQDASADAPTDTGGNADGGVDADSGAGDAATDAYDGGTDAPSDGATDAPTGCSSPCHGSALNAGPPSDTKGNSAFTEPGVGAHQAHLTSAALFRTPLCQDCHAVPSGVGDPGHADTPAPAELTWGKIAESDGVSASYSGGKCSVYCHGKSLGAILEPTWTKVGSGEASCGSCHGLPPAAPHPELAGSGCAPCHNFTGAKPNDPSTHVDGKVDLVSACETCHGSATNYAPPKDTQGNTQTSAPGVGAHQAHLGSATIFRAVLCTDCHKVPAVSSAPGHMDGLPAELVWGTVASADGVTPGYANGKCSVYCHGKSLGSTLEPEWTKVGSGQAACGKCHGLPPAAPHPTTSSTNCAPCHGFNGLVPNDPSTHVNGKVELTGATCNACHGSATSFAPPKDTQGNTQTTVPGVGAHQAHLDTSSTFRTVLCVDCHKVPAGYTDPGHMDTPPAEFVGGLVASADGVTPSYANGKCSVYCHGKSLGSVFEPQWTKVGSGEAACGKCHGLPPPAPHPAVGGTTCAPCHDFNALTPKTPSTHVDGKVDLATNMPCNACHGGAQNAAPPSDTAGQSLTTFPGVGAHQAHLGSASIFRKVQCSDCHSVPTSWADPGHLGALPGDLSWGSVASAGGVTPGYAGGKCSVYCHGASLGSPAQPEWTKVGAGQAACGTCHALPPPAPHPAASSASCAPCHDYNKLVPKTPATHVDGKVDVIPCGGCHAVAPGTGAHKAHYGDSSSPPLASYADLRDVTDYAPGGAPHYAFGCGNCHPLDHEKHGDGVMQVELFNSTAPVGSLKALTPATASYSGGKCSNTYCHSSGQSSPSYVETPAWAGGTLPVPKCAACHANPPRYASGGAGSATANTHVVMADDGYELGHFGGMPGPWHTSYHGAPPKSAAPITCQTCHYQTVDSLNVGPGGFYYLDTSGNYDLGGALGYTCTSCHTGVAGAPATKNGQVRTALHVNGVREVSFDPRTSIPASVTGLPAAPNRPTRPYWVSAIPSALPPGSSVDGTTWSLSLDGASYDPQNKTCANVPCHIKQSFSGGPPLAWGTIPVGWATCSPCH